MSIFFTSDLHFNHKNIIEFCNRPYSSVEEMNESLIENWNKVVSQNDTIYFLGDFGWGNYDKLLPIFQRLNGKNKILITGNHDEISVKLGWTSIHNMLEVKLNSKIIQLCHYPMRSWNKSLHGSWSLFGHAHGTLSPHGWSCDVGVDCWNYVPVTFEQLNELFKTIPRDFQGHIMPTGMIWNANRHVKYGFKDFFIGDGSLDEVDPNSLFK